jgi:hypothetical protein
MLDSILNEHWQVREPVVTVRVLHEMFVSTIARHHICSGESRLNLAILESSFDQDETTVVPTHEIAQMAVPEPVGQQAHFSKIGGKCEGVCWNGIADRQKL